MSMSAADGAHEFVVAPELAEVAERLGVLLHAKDRIRFGVLQGAETARRGAVAWAGEHALSERGRDDVRSGTGRRTG